MKTSPSPSLLPQTVMACLLALVPPLLAQAQNAPAIHWINDSGQNAATVLNGGGTFTTSFQGTNDVTVTRLPGTVSGLVNNFFGGATPGNNPGDITSFLGSPATGTGTGTAGTVELLGGDGPDATASLQFDFATPLTIKSHIAFVDVDTTEQYKIQAYALVSGTYQLVNLGGWTHDSFSGQSGTISNSTWAVWDSSAGTLTAPAGHPQINSPLDVLTPGENVDRLVISKLSGTGGGWSFDVVNSVPEPASTCAVAAGTLERWWMLRLRGNAQVS